MDAAAAPPPDLTTVVAPLSRGPPSAVRPPGQRDPGGSPTAAAFDLLLQMLGAGLPAGQSLPVGGSALPASGDGSAAASAPGACAGAGAPANVESAAANGGAADAQPPADVECGAAPLSFSPRRAGSQTDEAAQQQ